MDEDSGNPWELAAEFAIQNGILKRSANSISLLSCTILPSPVPKHFLDRGRYLQPWFNLLYHKVSQDYEFLQQILKPCDDFICRLWNVYLQSKLEGVVQPVILGLNRSDYMLHVDSGICQSGLSRLKTHLRQTKAASKFPVEHEGLVWQGIALRQVEVNMIATSFAGLMSDMVAQHRTVLALEGYSDEVIARVPECNSAEGFAEALAMAHFIYIDQCKEKSLDASQSSVLMVIGENETNVYDQRALLQALIRRSPRPHILIRKLVDLHDIMRLDEDKRLFVDNREVSVVYFRTGYTPSAFPDEKTWKARLLLEKSFAIKCPCIEYVLANTKLVQAALCKPKYLSRFLDLESMECKQIMSTFARQYTLCEDLEISDKEEIKNALKECFLSPCRFVLKPQREGGGNNYFGDELITKLKSILVTEEKKSFVLMERLNPYIFENRILAPYSPASIGLRCSEPVDLVGELGIYGVIIAKGDEIIMNKTTGHILRSKPVAVDEGGIVAGFGCLDSPFLV